MGRRAEKHYPVSMFQAHERANRRRRHRALIHIMTPSAYTLSFFIYKRAEIRQMCRFVCLFVCPFCSVRVILLSGLSCFFCEEYFYRRLKNIPATVAQRLCIAELEVASTIPATTTARSCTTHWVHIKEPQMFTIILVEIHQSPTSLPL